MINKQDLLQAKTRALRLKIWFKVLSRTERAIMDLTLKCVERIRSNILEAAIKGILGKITEALECRFLAKANAMGRKMAQQAGEIAWKWGNKEAHLWKRDSDFIRYLGVNAVNQNGSLGERAI